MSPLRILLTIAFIAVGVIMTIVILKQESKQRGLSGALTGASLESDDSYWAKNKGRSKEGKLVIWSRILIGIFLGLGVILSISAL